MLVALEQPRFLWWVAAPIPGEAVGCGPARRVIPHSEFGRRCRSRKINMEGWTCWQREIGEKLLPRGELAINTRICFALFDRFKHFIWKVVTFAVQHLSSAETSKSSNKVLNLNHSRVAVLKLGCTNSSVCLHKSLCSRKQHWNFLICMRSMNATHFLSLGHSFLIWINYPISPLWHSVSHSVRCAGYLPALCHVLGFSCLCVHSCQVDWMLCFLYCLRLIWNSNIASLLSLNNIDFHLHSPETPGIYLGQDCVSFFSFSVFIQFVLQHLEFFWTADVAGYSLSGLESGKSGEKVAV